MYNIIRFQHNICSIFPMAFTMFWYIYKEQSPLIWLFGLINAILFTVWVHQLYFFVFYQFLYFQIICDYLKLRLINLNEFLTKLNKKKRLKRKKIFSKHSTPSTKRSMNTTPPIGRNFYSSYGP